MKQLLILFSIALSLATLGCEKNSEPDPIDSSCDEYLGTYQVTFSGSCGNGTGALIVKKGSSCDQLLFTDNFQANYPVNLSGNSFSIPTYIQNTVINGVTVSIQVFGNGSFVNGGINYTETSKYGPPENYTCTSQVIGTK